MWKTTALTALTLGLSGVVAHADPDGLWQPQIRAIVGADNNGGNAALEGFIPIKQSAESVLFLDVRAKHDFKDASGQDIGLGIRRIVNPDLMLGGYAYINVENYNSTQFTAGTLGVEAITPNFDAHVNVFVPIKGDSTDHSVSSSLSMVSNQLIEQISVLDHRDYAAWGVEGEVGAQVPINLPDKHSLRLDIGGYHFEDPHGDDGSVTGAKAGFEYTIGDVFGSGTELVLAGEVRDDNRDHTQFAGSVRLNIPFNPVNLGHGSDTTGAIGGADPVYPVSEGLRKRVNERVRGDIGVRVQSQDQTGGSTTRVAINAATNAAFGKFYFADGGLAGAGTLTDPTTLDDAVTKAGSGGFVVALGGNGNIQTSGQTLAAGQTLIGGGESVTAKLFGGGTGTFNLGGSDGTIQGVGSTNVITLGNNNTLNGITLTGDGNGIFGNNITGTTLTNVTVTGTGGNGAEFTGDSTNVSASNFIATGNGLDGLHIEDNGTYNFTGTTLLSGNLDDGLDITGQGTYTFATVNALNNTDRGITVQGTSSGGSFTTTGGNISGNGGIGVYIDPITAHVVLDSITQTGGTAGVVLDHVSGSFTVNDATNISGTSQAAIQITASPAAIRFGGDVTINAPNANGIDVSGINGTIGFGNVFISGLTTGTGLDLSGSTSTFTATLLNITGAGTSTGIDLSGTGGGSVTIGSGTISVGTGVQLGTNGASGTSANTAFSFGGGSITGSVASLDARGLNQTLGTYAFGSTDLIGNQLFDTQNVIFVGSSATGSGTGSSLMDLATIGTADADTDSDAIFVLVNDGTSIDASGGFSLSDGQTLASFGNGRTFSLGGVPINVTGDDVEHDQVVSDAGGAATLTNSGAGAAVTLASNSSLLDFNIAAGSGNGIHGSGVSNVTISGVNVSGSSVDGVLFDGTNSVTGNNLSSTGNTGNGLSIQGDGTYTFTGTTTLSNNSGDGLKINGNGNVGFATLDAKGNSGSGVDATSTGTGKLTSTGGTISGNSTSAFSATNIQLGVTLDTLSQTGGTTGISLSDVTGAFSVTGTTTLASIGSYDPGLAVQGSAATVTINDIVTTNIAGTDVSLTNNTGTIAIGGTITKGSGLFSGVVISGGSAAITISADISGLTSAPMITIDGITGGSVNFSGDVSSSLGSLFVVGGSAGPTGGAISFTGSALTATGGLGGEIHSLGSGATFNATAPITVTGTYVSGGALTVQDVEGTATFGAVTVSVGGGLDGIDIVNNTGTVTFGTTNVTLGVGANTAGIKFSDTNADVSFGTTNVTLGAGASQTGIDFSGSSTTATFGLTTITGTGDLTSRGIDLSSTTGNKTITFLRGSSISNAGVGVELSSGGTTATSANANFTFGDGTSADGLQSSISAAAGGYTVNTIGLDPTLGNYNFNDVTFTGPAHLASAVGGVIMVSQNGGVIAAGTDGLSASVTTISVAAADAMTGTNTFAFVGTVDLSATTFTLDSGQSITGFGNGNSITTAGTIQPINVQGNLGATGANVTGNEGVVTGTADFMHLLGNNTVLNTAFDFTGATGSVFTIDQNAAGFSNAGGITIQGVTVSNVAAGQTAFKVVDVDTNVSITNNNINVAGTLLDANGGSGNITVTRGTLPNSATPGTLTGGGISIANRTGGTVNFTDNLTIGGNGVSLTGNTGSTVTFADLDVSTNGATAFTATGGGAINVTTGTVANTNGQAIALDGITAGINFTSTSATFGSGSGIDLQNLAGTASFGTGTLTNTGSGGAFNVGSATNASGGNATISYGGTIASNGTGASVSIQELTGGSVTLSGNLTDGLASDGGQIFVGGIDNGTAATVTFSGTTKQISSGASTAVQLGFTGVLPALTPDPNTNGTINFTNGGLDITTTTGTGFGAAFGGTVSISGSGNKIASGSDGLFMASADVGSGGITFDSISAVSTSNGGGVALTGVNLGGDVNIGGLTDTGYLGAALSGLTGTGVVNFTGTTNLDVSYRGFQFGGAITTVNIANVAGSSLTIDGGSTGIALDGMFSGAVNVGGNGGTASIGATTSTTGWAINLNGNTGGTLNYNGSIKVDTGSVVGTSSADLGTLNLSGSVTSTTASTAFDFAGADGTYTISSTISHTGATAGTGVSMDGASDGTVTFSGTSKIFSTGTNDAIVKAPHLTVPVVQGSGTLAFTNGGLVITTTSGDGFTASTLSPGTVSVSGTGNTITTGTGTALNLDNATVGADGINFDSISSNGAATGISLNNVSGGAISLGAADLQGITSRGVDISGTLGSALSFDSLNIVIASTATNAVGFDLNGAALGASNITMGDFDVDGGLSAGSLGIDMAGTTGTGTIQLGDTVNNNPGPAGQTSTIANVAQGVQFSSTTNAKLVFGDGQGPAESSISTFGGGQVIHATDSLPTSGDYNFNDVNFTGDTANLASISVYYVIAGGTGDGSLANPGSYTGAQASTANVIVLIDKTQDNSQATIDLAGTSFNLDDGQVLLAFKSGDAAVDVSQLGVDASGGASAAFHFTTIQNTPVISAPTGIDTFRPVLQSNTAGSVINFATTGSGVFTGGIANLIIRNTGTGDGVAVDATAASSFFLRNNDIAAGGMALDFITGGAPANALLLSIDGNTLQSTGSALAASFSGQNINATDNSIAIRSFAGNTVIGGTGGGIAFNNVRFDSDGAGGTVSAGTLGVGNPGARVQGNGLSFTNTSGTLDLGALNLANNGGTGVLVNTKGANTTFTLNNSGGVVLTTNGAAFNLDPLTVNMTFATVTASGGASGIIFDGVAGTFTVTGATTISNTTGFGIDAVNANTGTFNFNTVTVNNTATTGGGIDVASGTLNVSRLANIDTSSGIGVSQGAGNTSFTGGLTIDTTSGDGFLAVSAGTITVSGTGNTITTATGRVLSLQTATIGAGGMTFDTLTATGTASGPAIQISNVSGGVFDGGDASIAGSSNNAITVQNGTSSTVNFDSATISGASVHGIDVTTNVTGPVTFGTVTISNTNASAVHVQDTSGTLNINGGTITANDGFAGLEIVNGAGTVTIAAAVTKTNAGKIVDISGVTGGTVALSGNLSATGGFDNGVNVHGNTGGTFNFSGATKTLTTGANTAVNLATNTGATVNFTGGGLAINTTSGAGFNATGGGTVNVTGATNTSTTTANGTALNLNGVTVGTGGVNFSSVTTSGVNTATGISLANVTSSGGGAIALGTVNLSGITGTGVSVSGTQGAALSFNSLVIGLNSSTATAFSLNGATINAAITANDFDVTNAAAGAGSSIGVDLRGAHGSGTVQLGDTAVGGASSSISGVNTGVFLNSTTNLTFVYGDGESAIDQGSTISANVGIDTSSAPASGSYNFQDVNFQSSPGLGFGIGKIYFVGATATGDGSGKDQSNLATLTTAEAAAVSSDIIVLVNNGVITAAGSNGNDTLVLQAGEQVRGFGNGNINLALSVPSTIHLANSSISITDQTSGGAATLTTTDTSTAITLGSSGNIIDGFTIDGSDGVGVNAAIGISGATSGATISNMTIRNVTATDIDFGSGATGTTTLTNLSLFSTGAAGTGIKFGAASGTVTGTNVDFSGGGGLSVVGGNAAISFDSTSSISSVAGTAVRITNRTGGSFGFAGTVGTSIGASGIAISGATGANTVSFTGAVNLTANGGTPVSIDNGGQASTVSFANLAITTGGTNTAFTATNGGTVNVATGSISATAAQAVNLNGIATTTGITFTSTSSGGGANNVVVSGVTGAGVVNLGTGSLTGATGVAFLDSGGTASVTYGGSITKTSDGRTIDIQNRTGGTVTFNGAISSTGASDGIFLNSNTGSTINFTGALTIDTSSSDTIGFNATGGGTVSATASGSTIDSGTATALNVVGTTIGSGNLVFQSISTNGATNGIVLNNTGLAAGNGGLTVTGVGTTSGSGGTIQNAVQGALFTSTKNLSLSNMNFTNADSGNGTVNNIDDPTFNSAAQAAINMSGVATATFTNLNVLGNGGAGGAQVGINGQNVSNLTIANSTVTGFGDAAGEGNVKLWNLSGTSAITNSTFGFVPGDATGGENLVEVRNNAGTLTLNISGSTFQNTRDSTNGSGGFAITTTGSAVATVNVSNSSFLNLKTSGVEGFAKQTSTLNVNITDGGTVGNGNTFDPGGTTAAFTGRAIGLNAQDTAQLNFNINRNKKIYGHGGPVINIFSIDNANIQGRIDNNTDIRNNGTEAIPAGSPININAEDNSTGVVEVIGNTIIDNGHDAAISAGVQGDGISKFNASLDLTVQNNNITLAGWNLNANSFNDAILLSAGASNDDATILTVNLQNNVVAPASINGTTGNVGLAIENTGGVNSHLYMEGFVTNPTTTWNNGGNTPVGSVVELDNVAPAPSAIPVGHNGGHTKTPTNPNQ